MSTNSVVLFENGIAYLSQRSEVAPGAEAAVTLRLKENALSDVLGSLEIFGAVEWSKPATFVAPSTAGEEVKIDPQNVLESVATLLRGAEVIFTLGKGEKREGALVGLRKTHRMTKGASAPTSEIVLSHDGKISWIDPDEIKEFRFTDAAVQQKLERALAANMRTLDQGSTAIELSVRAPEGEGDTVPFDVRYLHPNPTFALSYRLHQRDDGRFTLEAHAIVHNTTSVTWHEISLVTGRPVSFLSNLHIPFTPEREVVQIFDGMAARSVTEASFARALSSKGLPRARAAFAAESFGGYADDYGVEPIALGGGASGEQHGALSVFTPDEKVSLEAGQSANIRLFTLVLEDSGSVLFSKGDGETPLRAVRFTLPETLGFTLPKGPVTVVLKDDYAGSAVLLETRAGETRLLPHQEEPRVRVLRSEKRVTSTRVSVSIANGVLVSRIREIAETCYTLLNSTTESFEVMLEHTFRLPCAALVIEPDTASVEHDDEKAKIRLPISAASREEIELVETHERFEQESFNLVLDPEKAIHWISKELGALLTVDALLGADPKLADCLRLSQEIDAERKLLAQEVVKINDLRSRLEMQQQSVQAGGEKNPFYAEWMEKMNKLMNAIDSSRDETQPAINAKIESLKAQLKEALATLTAEWVQGSTPERVKVS